MKVQAWTLTVPIEALYIYLSPLRFQKEALDPRAHGPYPAACPRDPLAIASLTESRPLPLLERRLQFQCFAPLDIQKPFEAHGAFPGEQPQAIP